MIENGHRDHHAKTSVWLQNELGICKLALPANSPDFNSIANVWHLLLSRLKKHWRKNGRPKKVQESIDHAQEEWKTLDWKKIYSMIRCMKNRLEECIRLDDDWTKY